MELGLIPNQLLYFLTSFSPLNSFTRKQRQPNSKKKIVYCYSQYHRSLTIRFGTTSNSTLWTEEKNYLPPPSAIEKYVIIKYFLLPNFWKLPTIGQFKHTQKQKIVSNFIQDFACLEGPVEIFFWKREGKRRGDILFWVATGP